MLVTISVATPVLGAACTRSSDGAAQKADPSDPLGATQTVNEGAVRFRVPATWTRTPMATVVVVLVSPESVASFRPNVNLMIEPYDADVGALAGDNERTITERGGHVVSRTPAKAGVRDAFDLETRWPSKAPPVMTMQRYVVADGKAYVLTCTIALDRNESVRPLCRAILETLGVGP